MRFFTFINEILTSEGMPLLMVPILTRNENKLKILIKFKGK